MRLGSIARLVFAAATIVCVALPAIAQVPRDASAGASASSVSATASVVRPVCANCHEDKHTSILMTAHGAKNDAQGTMCQACHGDATEHLKDPAKHKPANLIVHGTAAQKEGVCLACHKTTRALAFWESGKHALNDVACTSCHIIHGKDPGPTIAPFTTSVRPNEAAICGTCHQDIRSQTLKPSHHPIMEGKVKCSDCHNPHGAVTPVMLRHATVNDQCVSCHTDKRGPFVFEHPPVEQNCISCHSPHGSSHEKLLNEHVPSLCQDCHDSARHPGTIYGGAAGFVLPNGSPNSSGANTRFVARGCVNCHSSIHGSNAPGSKGQYFLR